MPMMTSLALFHSKKFKEYSRCLYWTIVSSLKAAPVFNLNCLFASVET